MAERPLEERLATAAEFLNRLLDEADRGGARASVWLEDRAPTGEHPRARVGVALETP